MSLSVMPADMDTNGQSPSKSRRARVMAAETFELPDWACAEFVARFRRGDPEALEIAYCAYAPGADHVLANGFATTRGRVVISGVHDPQTRSDLLQDVFLKAFAPATRRSYDPARPYRPYLLTITRNVLCDWHRKQRRQQGLALRFADGGPFEAESPTEPWHAIDLAASYVTELEPRLRAVHDARFVLGKSQRAAAQLLGISHRTLRTFEHHLKEGLRRAVSRAAETD
jgi:RNA polymerase sigma-70 factor (ECF subfamily)